MLLICVLVLDFIEIFLYGLGVCKLMINNDIYFIMKKNFILYYNKIDWIFIMIYLSKSC